MFAFSRYNRPRIKETMKAMTKLFLLFFPDLEVPSIFQWTRTPPLINRNREDDIWITLTNHCPSLNVINIIDCEKPYELLLEESDLSET